MKKRNLNYILLCSLSILVFACNNFPSNQVARPENPNAGVYVNGRFFKVNLKSDSTFTSYIGKMDLSSVDMSTASSNQAVPMNWILEDSGKWNIDSGFITFSEITHFEKGMNPYKWSYLSPTPTNKFRWTGNSFCYNDFSNGKGEICYEKVVKD